MSEHTLTLDRRTFIGSAVGLATLSLLHPSLACAQTAAEKQAEADAVRNQLVGLQADLEAAEINYYNATTERDAAQAAMEAEQAKIDEATLRIADLQDKLGVRARSMYRNGPSSFLDFVLGAASFEEFTQNWYLLNNINEEDSRMVEETKTLREQLEISKDEYARQQQIAAQKADEALAIEQEVQAKVDNATALVDSLDAEARELLLQEQAAAAAAAAAEAEAARQNSGGTDVWSVPEPSYSGNGGSVGDYGGVVGYAMSRIGCPYVWGAAGPDSFDCSGLVQWAYAQVGRYVPHQSEALYAAASRIVPISEARPGDVLWRYGHVGIATSYGGATYVHAPTFGACVRDTDSLSWSGFTVALQF